MKRDIETGNIGTTKAMCLVHDAGPGGLLGQPSYGWLSRDNGL